jgi:predicted nucleic acid-binding protein
VSDLVLDASLALQRFLEDESGRQYGLLMAYRRKRITFDQIDGFLTRLKALPIDAAQQVPTEILELPAIAQKHSLTNYDAAHLALAMRFRSPLATTDAELRRAAAAAGVAIVPG